VSAADILHQTKD